MSEIFRGFWHGSQLGAYELLCMRSAVHHGHRFELFTYDKAIAVPDWVARRDAQDILPASDVLFYRSGLGAGSPALHSNIFRYQLLNKLDGWWVDLDMLVLRADLPAGDEFYASDARGVVLVGALRLPRGSPLLAEAIRRSEAVPEASAQWGQTGPQLMTDLVAAFACQDRVRSAASAYPFDHSELDILFDPDRCDEVEARASQSWFMHLYNELRRRAGFPREAGPPQGSYLDRLFEASGLGIRFPYRLHLADLRRWLNNHFDANTYRTLYELSKSEPPEHFQREFERRAAALEQQTHVIKGLEQRLIALTAAHAELSSTPPAWQRLNAALSRLLGSPGRG